MIAAGAQTPGTVAPAAQIEQAMLAPLFAASFMCSEHWAGQLKYPGDALGQDCMVTGGLDESQGETAGFARLYRGDGSRNEDWYGWGEPVLAPLDGVVQKVNVNPVVNNPGTLGKPPASFIVVTAADGTSVLMAHVAHIRVKEGDKVTAGQQLAVIGNNGFGRAPHIHVGAFRENSPLQIRWDLRAMAKLMESGEE